MNVKINYPEDKDMLETIVAYIKAKLMEKYICDLNVPKASKIQIQEELIKVLSKTWNPFTSELTWLKS